VRHSNEARVVKLAYSPSDPVCADASVRWALTALRAALEERGVTVREVEAPEGPAAPAELTIRACGAAADEAALVARRAGIERPDGPESFAFVRDGDGRAAPIAAIGADSRGLVYALLELRDRVRCADDAMAALAAVKAVRERPRTPIRGVMRLFVSEIEDKPWFYDRAFWDEYLTELATQRFNRFHLALGIGYDSGHDPGVKDNYFCFAYPFFVDVPGYRVRVGNLPDGEAERNLETLRYIGEQAKLRGLHFQLGLWTHAYTFPDSPELRYPIEGVTPDNHARYCRDALRALLAACPSIDGVTLRVHYESGIPEPAGDFWRVVMEGAERDGRRVELDLHSKGVDHALIAAALDTGSPVLVSSKYWAEHLGLPYHQADIRATEKPDPDRATNGFDAVTAASRRFTRYGYADFLQAQRRYGTLYRVWPGTQRLLLWGDPAMAAGYGRFATFGGSRGIEWFEPLSFKGRKGSGSPGGRDPYADAALRLDGREWTKYLYTYRLWGRLAYDPEADPDGWRRLLRAQYGAAAPACEAALAYASRILPLVTVAHHPSAANNMYWPEMYTNQPIVPDGENTVYGFDSPPPHTFGAASPLDPELFYRVDEFADDVVRGTRRGKMSPPETAERLEALADAAERHLSEALALAGEGGRAAPQLRRLRADVAVQLSLGRFFAGKLRAALAYAMHERTGDAAWLREAVRHYRAARTAWEAAAQAADPYAADVTFGFMPHMRGHWRDRIAAIDRDIAAMEGLLARAGTPRADGAEASAASATAAARAPSPAWSHAPVAGFSRGRPLELAVAVPGAPQDLAVRLRYRRANHAESFQEAMMIHSGETFRAVVPGEYTDSAYPIVYYFEASDGQGNAWMWPGFDETMSNQPYFVATLA
jgi:hypothetical protein